MTDPLYSRVPKGFKENLAYRRKLLALAANDKGLQAELRAMCAESPLFFFNVFGWVLEPRMALSLPFITWEFQDDFLVKINAGVDRVEQSIDHMEDFVIEKSRDQGATVCLIWLLLWRAMFKPLQMMLMASWKQDLVDKTGDPDTLFAKLDFDYSHIVPWLRPECRRFENHFEVLETGSCIDGAATTDDFGRAGRRLIVWGDEFASYPPSTQSAIISSITSVTNCRIFTSTPKGVGNEFYNLTHAAPGEGPTKFTLHWTNHPFQRRGLYRAMPEKVEKLDLSYDWSGKGDYPFVRDGSLRSPWYDAQCKRFTVASLRAQELDLSYTGSGSPVFSETEIRKAEDTMAMDPFHAGELTYDPDLGEPRGFVESAAGKLRLWINLTKDNVPALNSNYVMGGDISAGVNSSNTCFSIVDRMTGEKVAEYVDSGISPERAAALFCALGHWFKGIDGHPAFAIWEDAGPGVTFGVRLCQSLKYANVYWKSDETKVFAKIGDRPGWKPSDDAQQYLIRNYAMSLAGGKFVNRSRDAIREMYQFQYLPSGRIGHVGTLNKLDPSGAAKQHGDRVIADALACLGCTFKPRLTAVVKEAPFGSYAWRSKLHAATKEGRRYAGIW